MWLQIVCYKELSGRWGKKKKSFPSAAVDWYLLSYQSGTPSQMEGVKLLFIIFYVRTLDTK